MQRSKLSLTLISPVLAGLFSLGLAASALATPVMDFRAEDVLSAADGLKDDLHLNPNQQTLWGQLAAKTKVIVKERERRQQDLQANMRSGLNNPNIDLRQLSTAIDAESSLSAQDGRQLRELWLTMNDALDDQQRQAVRLYLADRLQRASDAACEPRNSDTVKPAGKSHGGRGMGGMGGGSGGMGGGNGM
ncbi:hypothetical protein [Collimonas arenae]|uniref:hypothetical protein n=1 Tax=Collimonas arenae TaxID=279058 RepID=UPI000AF30701|nr:hypothetical protein [Collimonas arenae]